ncbi:MAG: hypothetical protein WCF16_11850 [Alphaproteobacteria bacterium]
MGYALIILALMAGEPRSYLVTDPMLSPGQDGGPSVTPAGCAVKAMTEGQKWLADHAPGAEFQRAICVPTDRLDSMQFVRVPP